MECRGAVGGSWMVTELMPEQELAVSCFNIVCTAPVCFVKLHAGSHACSGVGGWDQAGQRGQGQCSCMHANFELRDAWRAIMHDQGLGRRGQGPRDLDL